MKRFAGIAVGAAALALAAGCAGAQHDIGFGGQPPTGAPTSSPTMSGPPSGSPDAGLSPHPPAGGTPVPPDRVTPVGLPNGQPTLVWTADDGRTLGVYGREGGCGTVHGELAEQSPAGVRIVLAEQVPAKPRVCTMILRYRPLTLALGDPLGDRPVTLTHRLDKVGG